MRIENQLLLEIQKFNTNLDAATARTRKRTKQMKKDASGVGGALAGGFQAAIGKMAAIAAPAVIGKFFKDTLVYARDVENLGIQLGETSESIQVLDRVGKQAANVGVRELMESLTDLEERMSDTDSEDYRESIEQLGLSAEKLARMTAKEKIFALAEGFKTARAEGMGMKVVMDLMSDQGRELIPLLEMTEDQITALFDASENGQIISDEEIARAAQLNKEFDSLTGKIEGRMKQGVLNGADWGRTAAEIQMETWKNLGDASTLEELLNAMNPFRNAQNVLGRQYEDSIDDEVAQKQKKDEQDQVRQSASKALNQRRLDREKEIADAKSDRQLAAFTAAQEKQAREKESKLSDVAGLKDSAREKEIAQMSPEDQVRAIRDQLSKSLGIEIDGLDDIDGGIARLRKEAATAEASGDLDAQKATLEKLNAALESKGNLVRLGDRLGEGDGDGTRTVNAKGTVAGAIEQIFDRDASQLQLAAIEKQTNKLESVLKSILAQNEQEPPPFEIAIK